MIKKQIKRELESLGERVGDRLGQTLSKDADKKGAQVGKKVGVALGKQVERLHDAISEETVTKEEQIGIGGKIGTGVGIIGKRLVEKRHGLLGKLMGSGDLVSEGRTLGAKAEKIVKRGVKAGINRISGAKPGSKGDAEKGG
ncbi:MAG: hypothetical protein HWN68_05480 [Desulfobacterales bacterium]|nr:hypothetical protein [Desulfobacterales bacterium]